MKRILLTFISVLILFTAGCKKHNDINDYTSRTSFLNGYAITQNESNNPNSINQKHVAEASIEDVKLIGYSSVMVCGKLEDEYDSQGFMLLDEENREIYTTDAILFEDNYYAKITGLENGRSYTLRMYGYSEDIRYLSSSSVEFSTPAIKLTKEEVEQHLNSFIDIEEIVQKKNVDSLSDEEMAVCNIQQCLKMLGLKYGKEGEHNLELQLNELRLEYSYNSYGRFVFWDNVDDIPDNDTYNTIIEIMQTKESYSANDFIFDFVPAPHSLVEYNLYTDIGGQMDSERYIYETALLDDEAYEYYKKYPFIYETDEFKEKYADLVSERQNGKESMQIEYIIAKNKVMFSRKNEEWLKEKASPREKTILLMQPTSVFDAIMIVQAAVAYSYLYMQLPTDMDLELDQLWVQCGYRDYDIQCTLYSKIAGTSFSEVYKKSGAWHYDRQVQSYVPGFSNHQYGTALDFGNIYAFRYTNLYPYLKENAARYGFYNYYVEPWHWVYLGE